ncbi:hypothetical protein NXX77_22465 [Phocaeicola dorei]|nr:hypothetical protein [Phocaeicola dorei]WHX12512.1 hypothetical protein QMY64_15860 [Phocaeicola dorei]
MNSQDIIRTRFPISIPTVRVITIQPIAFKRFCLFQGVTKLRQNVTGIPKLSEEREVITDKKWW